MDKLLVPSTPGPNPRITLLLKVPQPQGVSSLKRPSTCSSQQFMTDKYEPVSSVFYAVSLCQTPASLPWVGHAYDEKHLDAADLDGVFSPSLYLDGSVKTRSRGWLEYYAVGTGYY
nr:hypothetical protein L203_02645 [Cryptococcus depauperatus CBS 7841]